MLWDTTAAALRADQCAGLGGDGDFLTGIPALDAAPGALLAGRSGFRGGDLVELYGRAGAGASQLLTQLVANAAVRGAEPLLIDADGKFSATRLHALVAQQLQQQQQRTSADVIEAALARVAVVRCPRGSEGLLAALAAAAAGETARRRVVVIDSVNAFFWEDRADGDAGLSRQRSLVAAVRALCEPRRNAIVFAAKQALFPRAHPATGLLVHPPVGGDSGFSDLVGPGWEQAMRFRLVVDRGLVVAGSGMLATPFKVTDAGIVCGPPR